MEVEVLVVVVDVVVLVIVEVLKVVVVVVVVEVAKVDFIVVVLTGLGIFVGLVGESIKTVEDIVGKKSSAFVLGTSNGLFFTLLTGFTGISGNIS